MGNFNIGFVGVKKYESLKSDLFTICDTTEDGFSGFKGGSSQAKHPGDSSVAEKCQTGPYYVLMDDNYPKILETEKVQGYRWQIPYFIFLITLLQVSCFMYFTMPRYSTHNPYYPHMINNNLVYDPEKKTQIWRFLTYMLLHFGWSHLLSNMVVQLIVGIPLEMIHGSKRIAIIYLGSVVGSCVGNSFFDNISRQLGASGGVYGLIAAYLSDIILNHCQMKLTYVIVKLVAIILIPFGEMAYILWEQGTLHKHFNTSQTDFPLIELEPVTNPPHITIKVKVNYEVHIYGAITGFLMGLAVLKSFGKTKFTNYKNLSKLLHTTYDGWPKDKKISPNKFLQMAAISIVGGLTVSTIVWYTYLYVVDPN